MFGFSDRKKTIATVALLSATAAAALPAASSARPTARPDLVVTAGAVNAANGKLTGSFVVKNSGHARAGTSFATLIARASGRSHSVKSFTVSSLRASRTKFVRVSASVPRNLPAGTLSLKACADRRGAVRERSESNNCRTVGRLRITRAGTPAPSPAPAPSPGPAPAPAPGPAPSGDSRPTAPVAFTKETHFTLANYRIKVPQSYDSSHSTPTTLFVWAHGCGGEADGDLYNVAPGGDRSYIAISLLGRDGGCWDMNSDPANVLAAVADVKTHFNVNPRRVILGGYSSGGDLAYRTAFYNANAFAGVIVQNTSPFKDTGSSQSASLAAAAWKFNVVHLAQTGDDTYPIAQVREETDAMTAAGFPITRIERPGAHYDGNTDGYLQTLGLSHIDDGWTSPGV